jgi:hypothetical protein
VRFQPLVIVRLAGDVGERRPQFLAAVGVPDPAAFAVEPEQHLRHSQRQQLSIAEHRAPAPTMARLNDTIIDEDIQFGQEGF